MSNDRLPVHIAIGIWVAVGAVSWLWVVTIYNFVASFIG